MNEKSSFEFLIAINEKCISRMPLKYASSRCSADVNAAQIMLSLPAPSNAMQSHAQTKSSHLFPEEEKSKLPAMRNARNVEMQEMPLKDQSLQTGPEKKRSYLLGPLHLMKMQFKTPMSNASPNLSQVPF